MTHPHIPRRRIQPRLIRHARAHCLGQRIVDFEDDALGAVFAMFVDVFALDDGEGVENVGHIVACDAVEMEVGGVEFAAQEEAALFVPAVRGKGQVAGGKRRRGVELLEFGEHVLGEGLQVPGGVGEFEDAGENAGVVIVVRGAWGDQGQCC